MSVNHAPSGLRATLATKKRPTIEFPGHGLVTGRRPLDLCIVAGHYAGVQLGHGGPGQVQQASPVSRHRGGQLGHQFVAFIAL